LFSLHLGWFAGKAILLLYLNLAIPIVFFIVIGYLYYFIISINRNKKILKQLVEIKKELKNKTK